MHTRVCSHSTCTQARTLVPDCAVCVTPVWHGRRCPLMGSLPHVSVVCRCPWSIWIARASGCSQLWDARPNPRGALGARPRRERLAFLGIGPRCSTWLRAGMGRVHSGKGALIVGHRVPSKPKEWEVGPAVVRRLCRNLTGQGGAWTTRGAPKRLRLIIVSGRAPWRCFPHAVSFHSWGRNCPRAPLCRRRN